MTRLKHPFTALVLVVLAAPSVLPAFDVSTLAPGAMVKPPVVSVLALPAPRGVDHWSAASGRLDLPSGDPLTDPLRLTSAEERMFAAAANDRIEKGALVDAALVACGVADAAALERYHAQFESLHDALVLELTQNEGAGEVLEKIHRIHQVLHKRLLRRYDASATDLAGTLETGTYNCASATLLFVALAQEVDLPARGVELPGHVRAIVAGEDAQYEVEVTCPVWGQAVQPQWLKTGGSAALDPSHPVLAVAGDSHRHIMNENGREVSPQGLVAMIYYNRGVDAFNDRRFAEAVLANRKALLLDPENRAARGNLLASVNNWALAMCDAGDYADAQSLLAAGRRFDPTHAAFVTNAAHVERVSGQVRVSN